MLKICVKELLTLYVIESIIPNLSVCCDIHKGYFVVKKTVSKLNASIKAFCFTNTIN